MHRDILLDIPMRPLGFPQAPDRWLLPPVERAKRHGFPPLRVGEKEEFPSVPVFDISENQVE